MIKAIFFDFDGTISDARDASFESFVRTLEDYKYKFSKKKLRGLLGNKTYVIFEKLGLDKKYFRSARRRFYRYFTKAVINGEIKLCVSVKPLLDMKKDYLLVVISNSETRFIRASIKKLELKGLFRKVYGADRFSSKDKLLKKLFKKFGIKPLEAVYVGDRFSDVEFARKAGCVAVGIHNKCSWSSLVKIKKEGPGFIIRDFYGLKKVVGKLNDVE